METLERAFAFAYTEVSTRSGPLSGVVKNIDGVPMLAFTNEEAVDLSAECKRLAKALGYAFHIFVWSPRADTLTHLSRID